MRENAGRNRKHLEFTLDMASHEGLGHRRTLAERANRMGITPAYGKKYSLKQIVSIVCGDLEAERIRKTREEADQIALENEKARGIVIDFARFCAGYEQHMVSVKQIVESSQLTPEQQTRILNEFAAVLHPVRQPGDRDNQPGSFSGAHGPAAPATA